MLDRLKVWLQRLTVVPVLLALCLLVINQQNLTASLTLIIGLLIFGAMFAMISSLHSYLILAFTNDNRVTLDVGFYYTANALGRFLGTLLSGLTYQFGGIVFCLLAASVMLSASWLLTRNLR